MPITYNETGVVYDSTIYTWDGERYQPTVFPVAGIFVAWDDGPYTANPAWTEVTTDVRRFSIHRGRSSDFDQFEAGTAQITFDNRNRKYDPFYTSGSLYGKLLPRRQVRVVAQIGGVTYEVFRGFIAGWPVTWSEYGKDSTVTVQCFDALGLMINEQVPTDWFGYYTQSLNPYRWFRCSDAATTQLLRENSNLDTLRQTEPAFSPFFEYQSLGGGLISHSAYCPSYINYNYTTASYPQTPVTGNNDFTLSTWAQFVGPATPTGFASILFHQYAGRNINILYYFKDSGGFTNQRIYVTTSGFTGASAQYDVNFGASTSTQMHIVVTYTAATNAVRIYINGVDQTGTATATATSATWNDRYIVNVQNVAIQELTTFTRVLSTTEITNLYRFGIGQISETTSARMQRILDTTSWPAALESFPAAPVGTVAEIGSGNGVIAELQLVADSEGGEMFVSKNGVLTLTARRDVFNATRSKNVQATITDSGAGVRYGSEVEIMYDADNLKNDVTVNFSGDGEVVQTNAVTIAAYGANAATIETQLDSPTSATDLATLELGVEGVLVPQVSPLDVSANTAAADWQAILGLELLDRVNFKRTPTVGNQFSQDALINAIDHQVEPGQWRTQLTLSMRYTSPLTLDDSVLGRVDYNYLG